MKGPVGLWRAPTLPLPRRRPASPAVLLLLVVLAAMLLTPAHDAQARAAGSPSAGTPATAVEGDPLQMTITSMTPSAVPRPPVEPDSPDPGDQDPGDTDDAAATEGAGQDGNQDGTDPDGTGSGTGTEQAPDTLVMTGTITNTSTETWRNIRIYPRISPTALTSAEDLEVALNSDAKTVFGDRITDAGTFDDTVTSLPAGASATWRVEVPGDLLRSRISGDEGVYRVGVQALGANSEGRSRVAVGRARTLIPLIAEDRPAVPAALVVPVRHQVALNEDGTIANEPAWAQQFAPGGRLAHLANLMETPGTLPLTWLVDPAVLDAANLLSRGNPGRTLGGNNGTPTETVDIERHPAARYAADWLRTFTAVGADRALFALPYGDLDVAAAGRHDPDLYRSARQLATKTLDELALASTPAVSPVDGTLPDEGLDLVAATETLFVGAGHLVDPLPTPGPVALLGNTPAVVHADTVNTVNPGDEMTGTVVRQRILAEAAIRSLSAATTGMVVNLASGFDPGPDAAGFLAGLDEPFVEWQELSDVTATPLPPRAELDHRNAATEIGEDTVLAARGMLRWSVALSQVLSTNPLLRTQAERMALAATSVHARDDQVEGRAVLAAAEAWSRHQLSRITLDSPTFVILSSDSGAFAVRIHNQLDHEATVRIVASADDDVTIEAPEEIILGPGSTRTITLNARADSIGVHPVRLRIADPSGRAFSDEVTVNLRSNSVGRVIWVVMGVGVGILFVAIGMRWFRRLRGKEARDT